MKRLLIILFVLIGGESLLAGDVKFPFPGSGGMLSNVDQTQLDATQARLLYNVDTDWLSRGVLTKRSRITSWGGNNVALYGATGFWHPTEGHKVMVSIGDHGTFSTGKFYVSDTFGVIPFKNTPQGTVFPYADTIHDWTQYGDMLIHSDGKTPVKVFTTMDAFMWAKHKADTLGYNPRVLDLGMAGPGQLIVGDAGLPTGNLTGTFRYRLQFLDWFTGDSVPVHGSDSVGSGPYGPISASVRVNASAIYMTGFEFWPESTMAYTQSVVWRKEVSQLGEWEPIDTVIYGIMDTIPFILIDSGAYVPFVYSWAEVALMNWEYRWALTANSVTHTYDSCALSGFPSDDCVSDSVILYMEAMFLEDSATIQATCTADGNKLQFYPYSATDTVFLSDPYPGGWDGTYRYGDWWIYYTPVDTGTTAHPAQDTTKPIPGQWKVMDTVDIDTDGDGAADTIYWIAYSYYDPILGIESPMGPPRFSHIVDLTGHSTDTHFVRFSKGWTDTRVRASYIRIYQGVTDTLITGGGDTTAFYGVMETRANDRNKQTFGHWTDGELAAGLDTVHMSVCTTQTWELLFDENGYVIYRVPGGVPGLNYDLQIPFKGTATADGRLFGYGDPYYPNRLYWSFSGDISRWPTRYYLAIDETVNDEIIEVMEVSQGSAKDFLYVFKHNDIYLVASAWTDYGFNVTGGAYEYQNISSGIGAVSKSAIKEHKGIIYFMSPDLKCYALVGTEIREISQPIEDRIDSLFDTSYVQASLYCNAVLMYDEVMWFHDTTGSALSFNTINGLWSTQDYNLNTGATQRWKPRGSFAYDTSQSSRGFGYGAEKMFTDSATNLYYRDPNGVKNNLDRWSYHSGCIGDGEWVYMIKDMQVTVSTPSGQGGILRYAVFSRNGDSLCGGSDILGTQRSEDSGFYHISKIQFPPHEGTWLSVVVQADRLETDGNAETPDQYENAFRIHDIQITPRRLMRIKTE